MLILQIVHFDRKAVYCNLIPDVEDNQQRNHKEHEYDVERRALPLSYRSVAPGGKLGTMNRGLTIIN